MTTATLSPRALNRALLARQLLLTRAAIPAAEVVHRLVGLQAQIPADPYIALWSRLADFDPVEISTLIETRKLVRAATLRGTLHLMTGDDALTARALLAPVLERLIGSIASGRATATVDRKALIRAGTKALAEKPLTLAELRRSLAPRWPAIDPAALGWLFHYITPLVQVPPRGLWGRSGAPRLKTFAQWLGQPLPAKPSPAGLVRRYLAAFGPASVQDAQAWSRLTRLDAAFERLRPELVTFRDVAGRELFDLPDAPRPDPETPAPPRFLPVYDNLTLGFAKRDRIVRPDVKPPRKLADNAQVRTFLLDGFVAGFWKAEGGTLTLEPFAPLRKRDLAALTAEGRRLLRFVSPDAARGEVRLGRAY